VRACGGEVTEWEDRWRTLSGTGGPADLPTRPAGESAAAAAGARAGASATPPDEHDPAYIMAVLARVTSAASNAAASPAFGSSPGPGDSGFDGARGFESGYESAPEYGAAPEYEAPSAYDTPPEFDTPSAYETPSTYETPPTYETPSTYDTPSAYEPPSSEFGTSPTLDSASRGGTLDSPPVRSTEPIGAPDSPAAPVRDSRANGYPVSYRPPTGPSGARSTIPQQARLPLAIAGLILFIIILIAAFG
jgi:hypothetical protein